MIAHLTEWIKQLISLVLLATFADLLLPNAKLQKYTKIVIGLFIIVTLLNPLLQFLQMGNLTDTIRLDRLFFEQGGGGDGEKDPDANRLKAEQEREMMAYLADSLAVSVEQEIEQKFQERTKVEVQLHYEDGKTPVIEKMMVYFLGQVHKEYNKGEKTKGSRIEVTPVRPVQIGGRQTETLPASSNSSRETEVREYLKQRFQLPSEKIEVTAESSK